MDYILGVSKLHTTDKALRRLGIYILSLAWPLKEAFLFKAKFLKLNHILQSIGQILQPTFAKPLLYAAFLVLASDNFTSIEFQTDSD